jgi:hypothetical protein
MEKITYVPFRIGHKVTNKEPGSYRAEEVLLLQINVRFALLS